MIRQAISCDICGAEKKQTNHWFVVWEQVGELRVSGWNSRNRLRTGSKHLCGQACLHKLVDEFMAGVIAQKSGNKVEEVVSDEIELEVQANASLMGARAVRGMDAGASSNPRRSSNASLSSGFDTSLTSSSASGEPASSATLQPAQPIATWPAVWPAPAVVTMRERPHSGSLPAIPPVTPDDPLRVATRNRRAEAWERERERTQRAAEHRPEIVSRRISGGE